MCLAKTGKLHVICGALPLCTHSVAGFLLLAARSVWVSPKHALSAHFTRFLPDDLFIPAASELSQCALENDPCSQLRRQDAHWFTQPYACLSPIAPSICSRSDAHPYVSSCVSVCMGLFLCMCFFFL